ncbi:MAG: hypothetical protein OXB87_03690 [Hyphomicrobiales bacterium]|nr:hypothetical protein [Hyphomicrobiales bacterium]
MSETGARSRTPTADYLREAGRAAADFDRQTTQMFRRISSEQAQWQRNAELLARQMLRSLGQAETRSRRVSNELERLANRAAVLAARQFFTAQRGANASRAVSASSSFLENGLSRSEGQGTALWSRLVSSGLRAL